MKKVKKVKVKYQVNGNYFKFRCPYCCAKLAMDMEGYLILHYFDFDKNVFKSGPYTCPDCRKTFIIYE